MGKPSLRDRLSIWIANARFRFGWRILPASHKHVTVCYAGEFCKRCRVVV